MNIRLATYNIHGGVGSDGVRDYQRIGQHLGQLQVDIALLQEVDARPVSTEPQHNPNALCQSSEQRLVAAPAVVTETGWYGNALLSRYPVVESHSIDVSQFGFEPRNIQLAKLDLGDRQLRVINTHKGLKSAERRTQFAKLYELIAPLAQEPEIIILGGDFNEWQFFSRAFKKINQVLTPLRTGATFPSRWPIFRLDRLWISSTHAAVQVKVVKDSLARRHSDHCPIVMDVYDV